MRALILPVVAWAGALQAIAPQTTLAADPVRLRRGRARATNPALGHDYDKLSPYEAYLLLMPAHFHDVGNICGRQGHEKRIAEIIAKFGVLVDSAATRSFDVR